MSREMSSMTFSTEHLNAATVIVEGTSYVRADELMKLAPEAFEIGRQKNTKQRAILTNFNIPEGMYTYRILSPKGSWTSPKDLANPPRNAKLLIFAEWLRAHEEAEDDPRPGHPCRAPPRGSNLGGRWGGHPTVDEAQAGTPSTKRKAADDGTSARKRIEIQAAATESTTDGEGDDDNDDDDNDEVAGSNDRSANGKMCEVAPPLLELEEAEKFRDGEGQIVEIETRGERKIGAIYFRADDIGKLVENAAGDMRRKAIHSGAFLKGHQEDYAVFQKSTENRARNMFLTYRGAIRAFALSRNPKARPFLEWAVKILQTAQLGSDPDRAALAAELSRVDLKAALQVFRKCTPAPAGLYLIRVGTVADLRPAMGLLNNCNDDDLVVKWGRTKDYADRMATHLADFESIPGARPVFLKGIDVDPFQASRAETLIARFVTANGWKIESTGLETISDGRFQHRNRIEIAIVPKSGMRKLLDEYTKLQQDFAGGFAAILDKNQNLEKEAEHAEALYQAKLADERHQREAAERHCHTTLAYEREITVLKLAAAETRIKELERLLAARRPE